MCHCDPVFNEFCWSDLASKKTNNITKDAGVCAIRIRQRNNSIENVILNTINLFQKSNWEPLLSHISNRMDRLRNIKKCPIIYLGAAPSGLRNRYKDLCGRRHTVFFPILALLLDDWKLDFGWHKTNEALKNEIKLKEQYYQIHRFYPALVYR